MRNRAKCKKCGSIIESFHRYDFVSCKCNEISVDGGTDHLRCSAKDFTNFLRVDDEGNEIIVHFKEPEMFRDENIESDANYPKPSSKELIDTLEETIKNIDHLPDSARFAPVTHSDFSSALSLLAAILRSSCKETS